MKSNNQNKELLEQSIIELLQKGDQKSISLIYKNYSEVLYGIIFRIVQSEELAQEVLQDCFVKIWNKSSQYDPAKGRLFTWFVNIARNAAIDKVRSAPFQRNQKTQSIDVLSHQKNIPTTVTEVEDSGLKKIINSLDEKHRVLIEMIYFQGYSQREIEKELSIPLGTIKSRIRYAINELRSKLNSDYSQKLISFLILILSLEYLYN